MYSVKQQKRRAPKKTQRLSSQVAHKSGEIDKGFYGDICADRKTYCRGPMYGLRD